MSISSLDSSSSFFSPISPEMMSLSPMKDDTNTPVISRIIDPAKKDMKLFNDASSAKCQTPRQNNTMPTPPIKA